MKNFKENVGTRRVDNWMMKAAMIVAMMCCVTMTFAKKEKKEKNDFKAKLTLVDGTVIDGYLRTSMWDRPSSVGISVEKKGKIKKYKPEEVKELVIKGDEGPWTGLMAQRMPSIWRKNPGPYKKKVFLMQIYVGKNIKAYVMPITTYTPGRTMNVRGCAFKYYVLVNGEDIAKYFWYDSGAMTIGAKAALKLYFKDYPKMVEMLDNGQIDVSEVIRNPKAILPIFDEVIGENLKNK